MALAASFHSLAPPRLDTLDGVWRADELARMRQSYVPSGHGELDPELPGQGWPLGQLTEILQAQPGLHEWRLLLPALRQAVAQGPLVLVGAPRLPNLPALSLLGIPARQVLRVDAHSAAERLWATEQVLRGRELGALLCWLPQARSEQLRRLQLASTATQALVFAFRPWVARHESSPAPLRLALQSVPSAKPLLKVGSVPGEAPGLSVALLKRRGPTLDHPLTLAAPLPVTAVLRQRHLLEEAAHAVVRPASTHRLG
ncbi:translesion DNA synthesis-associated protein ImuA [Hylemonella sp. W303a]|uniref:translesion DNA synthesis-associated protein ImuA n=1 Tax=Hylemonella sp. W303a TaxID=3389873 RepID=UPI00396B348D